MISQRRRRQGDSKTQLSTVFKEGEDQGTPKLKFAWLVVSLSMVLFVVSTRNNFEHCQVEWTVLDKCFAVGVPGYRNPECLPSSCCTGTNPVRGMAWGEWNVWECRNATRAFPQWEHLRIGWDIMPPTRFFTLTFGRQLGISYIICTGPLYVD